MYAKISDVTPVDALDGLGVGAKSGIVEISSGATTMVEVSVVQAGGLRGRWNFP